MKKINGTKKLQRFQSLNHLSKSRRFKKLKLKNNKRRIRKIFIKRYKNHKNIINHEGNFFRKLIKIENKNVSNEKPKIDFKNDSIIDYKFERNNNCFKNHLNKNFFIQEREKYEINWEALKDNDEDSYPFFIDDNNPCNPIFFNLENEESFESPIRPYIDNLLNQGIPRPRRLVAESNNSFQINSNQNSLTIINNSNIIINNNNRNNRGNLNNNIIINTTNNNYNSNINNNNNQYYHISLSYNMSNNNNNNNSNNSINNNNNNGIILDDYVSDNNNNSNEENIWDDYLDDIFIDDFFYNYYYQRNKIQIKFIKKSLSKIKYKQNQNMEERCPICIEDFKKRQTVYNLPCSHIFHVRCLNKELKNRQKCPMCRKDLAKKADSLH